MDSNKQDFNINQKAQEIIRMNYKCCGNMEKNGILIKKVCDFFDYIKDIEINQTQLRFLYKFANIIGVPQYYEMLLKKRNDLKLNNIYLNDLCEMIYNSSLIIDKNNAFHKYQKEVYEKFEIEKCNRFFLTAPTSFGKTFIVYEIIKKMNYSNIVLIFPTISLLSENYIKLLNDEYFSKYKIHTLSDDKIELGSKNLFIFTPERFLSMMDKINSIRFDFIFMDEIYKIDNQFIIDNDTVGENERDLSFRVALQMVCKESRDILLAGPYIELGSSNTSSIYNFFYDNNFQILSYNRIEIVSKSFLKIDEKKDYNFEGLNFNITNKKTKIKLEILLRAIYNSSINSSIIYVDTRKKTEEVAKWIIQIKEKTNFKLKIIDFELRSRFYTFIEHLKNSFSENWIVCRSLLKGIGIHHSYIPKYIQKEIILFFNSGILDTIISTTTITEGINTTAKNMIVMSNKKGEKILKKFDAQNIAGRAGRFMCHYKGFVFSIDNDFDKILNSESEELCNIEYDRESKKSEVDILTASEKYLNPNQKLNKNQLLEKANSLGLDMSIIEKFKTVKLSDKIKLYESILKLSEFENTKLLNVLSYNNRLMWENFDFLLTKIYIIVENEDLKKMIDSKSKSEKKYSVLTIKVSSYLNDGFLGVLKFEMKRKNVDVAVKDTSKLTFNLFKYHLVKYLGIMDLLLRFNISKKDNKNIDDIQTSLTRLISMLEYNCIDDNAKKISDYGAPFKVVKYFDTHNKKLFDEFDDYERQIYLVLKEKFKI